MRTIVLGFALFGWGLSPSGADESVVLSLTAEQSLRLLPTQMVKESFRGREFETPERELQLAHADGKAERIDSFSVNPNERVTIYAATLLEPDTLAVVCRDWEMICLYVYKRAAKGWDRIQDTDLDLAADAYMPGHYRGVAPRFDNSALPRVTFERNEKGEVRIRFPYGEPFPTDIRQKYKFKFTPTELKPSVPSTGTKPVEK